MLWTAYVERTAAWDIRGLARKRFRRIRIDGASSKVLPLISSSGTRKRRLSFLCTWSQKCEASMLKRNKIISAYIILHGFFCSFCEIMLRTDTTSNVTWKLRLYYLIPIRMHGLQWILSLFMVIYLILCRKRWSIGKICGIGLNGLYLYLFLQTVMRA